MDIISRDRWGAHEWAGPVYSVPLSVRTEVLVHYHGGPPHDASGVAMAVEIEAIHLDKGWAGVGYNFMVGQDGVIYEGRGWSLVGAHCPGHNRTGIGIYVAVGGDQKPTAEALHAVRELYDEACRRTGRQLRKSWHGANYATECPGSRLIAWVRAGMPDPLAPVVRPAPTSNGDDMPSAREVADEILDTPVPTGEHGSDGKPLTFRWLFVRTEQANLRAEEANARAEQTLERLEAKLAGLQQLLQDRPVS